MKLIKKSTALFGVGVMQHGKAFAAILEPKAGFSPADVEQAAVAASASHLEWLNEKMLSAVINPASVKRLSSIAHITPKRVKQVH
jgi:hypothetical protein